MRFGWFGWVVQLVGSVGWFGWVVRFCGSGGSGGSAEVVQLGGSVG